MAAARGADGGKLAVKGGRAEGRLLKCPVGRVGRAGETLQAGYV
jgi:hypothetical protein